MCFFCLAVFTSDVEIKHCHSLCPSIHEFEFHSMINFSTLQLTAVRMIPWAKANLNYTAQALIISAGTISTQNNQTIDLREICYYYVLFFGFHHQFPVHWTD